MTTRLPLAFLFLGLATGCGPSFSAAYNFGAPRTAIKGNPLADHLAATRKKAGPRAAIKEAKARILGVAFPKTKPEGAKCATTHNVLTIPTSEGELPLVVTREWALSQNNAGGHALCQYLGFERAAQIGYLTGNLKKIPSHRLVRGRWIRKRSTTTYCSETLLSGVTPDGAGAWSAIYRKSRWRGPWPSQLTQDPVKALVVQHDCTPTADGRLACPAIDTTNIKTLYRQDRSTHFFVKNLVCTNNNQKAMDVVAQSRLDIRSAKTAPRFRRALDNYRNSKQVGYLHDLLGLLKKYPKTRLADEARKVLATSVPNPDCGRYRRACRIVNPKTARSGDYLSAVVQLLNIGKTASRYNDFGFDAHLKRDPALRSLVAKAVLAGLDSARKTSRTSGPTGKKVHFASYHRRCRSWRARRGSYCRNLAQRLNKAWSVKVKAHAKRTRGLNKLTGSMLTLSGMSPQEIASRYDRCCRNINKAQLGRVLTALEPAMKNQALLAQVPQAISKAEDVLTNRRASQSEQHLAAGRLYHLVKTAKKQPGVIPEAQVAMLQKHFVALETRIANARLSGLKRSTAAPRASGPVLAAIRMVPLVDRDWKKRMSDKVYTVCETQIAKLAKGTKADIIRANDWIQSCLRSDPPRRTKWTNQIAAKLKGALKWQAAEAKKEEARQKREEAKERAREKAEARREAKREKAEARREKARRKRAGKKCYKRCVSARWWNRGICKNPRFRARVRRGFCVLKGYTKAACRSQCY